MERFENDDLQYVVDDYYDVNDVNNDGAVVEPEPQKDTAGLESFDSDFEDDIESVMSKPKTDTSAEEARNGKDIQGIPWERLNFTRERYRQTRVREYKNYENLYGSREEMEKESLQVEKGKTFYDFQFNTRLVKSTIVHFQLSFANGLNFNYLHITTHSSRVLVRLTPVYACHITASVYTNCEARDTTSEKKSFLRNLLWATSKHDVYLMENYSVMHWSSLLHKGEEVLNVAKPIVPNLKHPGLLSQQLSRVQISTMVVKENLMVAGGFQGELICKYLNQSGAAFCTKLTADDNAITNAVDVYNNPSGAMRVMAANNDAKIRIFDAETFASINRYSFNWSVNNTSVSPDGKLLAVLGDSVECLIVDAQSGKVTNSLKGHLDYSFASAWHPGGHILATGNQDTSCRLWDIRNLSKSLAILKGRMGAIRGVKFTSDGRFLAIAEPADFVHIFDTKLGYVNCQEIDIFGEIAGISFSPDTEALFVGVADRTYGSLLAYNRRRYNQYLDSML
ncbi:hypothetical protein CXB51_011267 [Gossypium anomalum]|uniref:Transducin/WD40 repeat-like superfamily protein n=1 Tax=Gossypium anomalum TaxID=47600 RepID=A0A8J5YVR3_9ROSI|nr:hypothetical protein CXB51_011267 [Gossypium anomalum]